MLSKEEIQRHCNAAVRKQQRMRAQEEYRSKLFWTNAANEWAREAIRHLPGIIEREAKFGKSFCYISGIGSSYDPIITAANGAAEDKIKKWAQNKGFEAGEASIPDNVCYYHSDGYIAQYIGADFSSGKPLIVWCIKISWFSDKNKLVKKTVQAKLVVWAWVEKRGCKTICHVCTNEKEALEMAEKRGGEVLYRKTPIDSNS